jgi:shikimate dehydrogenase
VASHLTSHLTSHLIGLVGSAVAGSASPALFEAEADALGLRLVYRTLDVDQLGVLGGLGDLVRTAWRLGYTGLDVTHPCKNTIIKHLDGLDEDATALDAVNMISRRDGRSLGHNTDWSGFLAAFDDGLPGAAIGRVVVLGAGGAGSAIGHALLIQGTADLAIVDVEAGRAQTLAARLRARFPRAHVTAHDDPAAALSAGRADGLVNATPIGMDGHPGVPLPPALLASPLWVVDVIYRPWETALLAHARAAGCRALNGGGMLVHQAAQGFALLTGCTPDTARMLRHFNEVTTVEEQVRAESSVDVRSASKGFHSSM